MCPCRAPAPCSQGRGQTPWHQRGRGEGTGEGNVSAGFGLSRVRGRQHPSPESRSLRWSMRSRLSSRLSTCALIWLSSPLMECSSSARTAGERSCRDPTPHLITTRSAPRKRCGHRHCCNAPRCTQPGSPAHCLLQDPAPPSQPPHPAHVLSVSPWSCCCCSVSQAGGSGCFCLLLLREFSWP